MKGVVFRVHPTRRFGQIRSDDGEVLFAHADEVIGGTELSVGVRLEFDAEPGDPLRVAVNIAATGREAQPALRRGRITHWNAPRGIGGIHPQGSHRSIFFHVTRVLDVQGRPVEEGQDVTFDMGFDEQGRKIAVDIRRIPSENSLEGK